MENRGFTLIELMAIIIITSTIGILSYASLSSSIKNNKLREKNIFENSLISAAKLYMLASQEKYSNMESEVFDTKILCGEMIKNKYLNKNINNPTDINIYAYYVRVYKDENNFLKYDVGYDMSLVDSQGLRYSEPILNGADPIIDMGMIPIIIDNDGTIKKADICSDWYNYTEKRWANVVLVSDDSRHNYKMANPGSVIDMNDIKAFYVWIPRYKYQIFTDVENYEYIGSIDVNNYVNKAKLINIRFENISVNKSNGTNEGDWLTHPAFTFGDKELNGIWIGKFETTGTIENPTVLPYDSRYTTTSNMQSLRNTKTSVQFETSKRINYGLNELEPSMLKNIEWGAMAYLTSSIYGQGTTEVMINNSSLYNTGCAAEVNPTKTAGAYVNQTDHSEGHYNGCENQWYTLKGAKASTNGTSYGIYDTVGGSWEYMMSILEDSLGSGVPASGNNENLNSGFSGKLMATLTDYDGTSFPNSKYYDVYKYGTDNSDFSTRGLFGDGTIELDGLCYWQDDDGKSRNHTGWYKDYGKFVYNISPWMTRSGSWYDGASAGIFAFDHASGYSSDSLSFRSVIR